MKKLLLALLIICNTSFAQDTSCNINDKKIDILATIYPIYDITKELVKNNPCAHVDYLIDKGIDLHSYQAKALDIMKIQKSSLFIYIGGISDLYLKDILNHKLNKDMLSLNLIETLGNNTLDVNSSYIFEHTHGLEHEFKNEHEHEQFHHEHTNAYVHNDEHDLTFDKAKLFTIDEHIWLSLVNAKIFSKAIYEELLKLDRKNKNLYLKNLNSFLDKIDVIDKDFRDFLKGRHKNTVIFGDRFAFSYLLHDYNINYYAAFSGCSADIDASFNTVISLSKKVDELNLDTILVQEGSYNQIAKSISNNTKTKDKKIIELNSMQSVKDSDKSYLDIMQDNLNKLKDALAWH